MQVTSASDQPAASKKSAHEKAFDLFDAGKLSEKALLIAVGAERSGFELAEDLRLRTLTAFEDERLSEDAMIKLLSQSSAVLLEDKSCICYGASWILRFS